MKKIIKIALSALALSLFALGANAQGPKIDVSGGYALLHLNGSAGASGLNMNGFSASAVFRANHWLGLVSDFGVYHGSQLGIGVTTTTYTFGPRVAIHVSDRFTPYVQGLFGGSHFSASYAGASGSTNPFAFGFGGGTDIAVADGGKIAVRPEFDYMGFRANGSTQNSERFSIGIVYHIGWHGNSM